MRSSGDRRTLARITDDVDGARSPRRNELVQDPAVPAEPTDDPHRWVAAWLGSAVSLRPAGHADGEARVWRVEGSEGEVIAYLKQHRVPDKWHRERTILARLREPPAAAVPELLASDDEGLRLLLRACPGVPATSISLTSHDERSLHEQAGRLRRRLDDVPMDREDPVALPAALTRRLHAWIERARPSLPPALLHDVAMAFDPHPFEGATRRWCHRDLGPHNWIVQPTDHGPRLHVIDFGQARPDAWLVDVLKLWDDAWLRDPTLADAFFRGYGRELDATEHAQLRQLALLHGLATAAWGDRHAHAGFSHHGRAVLARALEGSARP
jgi:Ser/Thr protein kinase RdoA (MazF antagonist)